MRANSPSAITTSLLLHAFVVALLFLATVYVAKQSPPPVVFELVAGPPTARDELVAPALGNSATAPKPVTPKAVETPKTVQTPPVKAETVPPKPVEAKPKPDRTMAQAMKQQQRISYKEYLKSHPTPKPAPVSPPKAPAVQHVDTKGIAGGIAAGSTANTRGGGGGKALTREEQSELNTYISFLLNALKEAHEPPPGVSDKLEAKVTFEITAAGSILNPRISKSSGDRTFDESVLAAFRRVAPIGPTPDGKGDTWTVTFRMKDEE